MKKKPTFRIISTGGIGDVILLTPAFKALKQLHPGCIIKVFCTSKQHREIFLHNPYIDALHSTSFWNAPVDFILYYCKLVEYTTLYYGDLLPGVYYRKNATEIIAEMLGIQLTDKKTQIYLTDDEEAQARARMAPYRNPVTFHITSLTSENQHWPLAKWEQLIREMPEHTFIQLGLGNETKVAGAVDWRGALTLRQSIAALKYSSSFVGVVSALSHATNAVGTPGVVLFGPSTPHVWGHPNNINLYKDLRCAPCVDLIMGRDCPYNAECMQQISVAEVKAAVLKQTAAPGQNARLHQPAPDAPVRVGL